MSEAHFIFPLGTVVYPGGAVQLKIFEQRYIEMTKVCLRDNRPFGICLIREGREVGAPAVPERIGCLAAIEVWDMPQLGLFQLTARGGERFRLLETEIAANGLMSGSIERIPPDTPAPRVDRACQNVLQAIIDRVGASHFPQPLKLEDASWVGYRLAEILPLDLHVKQRLLEIQDAGERLEALRAVLTEKGLVDGNDAMR